VKRDEIYLYIATYYYIHFHYHDVFNDLYFYVNIGYVIIG